MDRLDKLNLLLDCLLVFFGTILVVIVIIVVVTIGQYEISMLDSFIFLIEFVIVIFIGSIIYFTIQDLKEKRDRRNK